MSAVSLPHPETVADGSIDQPLVWGALAAMTRRPSQTADALVKAGVRTVAVNRRYPAAVEAMEHFGRKVGLSVAKVADIYPFGQGKPLHELTGELWVSIAGEVKRPLAVRAAPGTSVGDLLDLAEPLEEHPTILVGTGPATARLATRWETVGPQAHSVLVLPHSHPLATRLNRTWTDETRISMSLCSNCRQCTDGCPQYLAGKGVEPHRLMRTLLYGGDADGLEALVDCHGCNLCSLVHCPVELSPSRWIADLASNLRVAGVQNPRQQGQHPFAHGRRVSVTRLAVRLGLGPYMNQTPTYIEG